MSRSPTYKSEPLPPHARTPLPPCRCHRRGELAPPLAPIASQPLEPLP
jgi:hypothetical protein